jgi:branched-chain amino acid aminotransferase
VITYVNGRYVPHEEATIHVDDRAIMFGDSVFDIARTFGGKPFRLDAHLDRLRRSMRYVELDPPGLFEEIRAATDEVVARNEEEIEALGDVFVEQVVSRGRVAGGDNVAPVMEPTVIVKLRRISFAAFAPFYERGVDLHVSLLTLPFAGPLDPRVKAANRLANARAELKGLRERSRGGGHWTLLFNADGSIPETNSTNICIVEGDRLVRPPRAESLGGVSIDTLCELARGLGLEVEERRITFYDLVNADETLMTATSFCVLPVRSVDEIEVPDGRRVFPRLLERWIDLVEFDFVAQARERAALQPAPAAAVTGST